jgi:hypothetical protein
MTWYKLILEQKQPIHIGYKRYGVLAEIRVFIPGQTMWGALTKSYNLMKGESLDNNQRLFEQITCFYPSFDGNTILKPNFKNGEFHLGEISEKEFRLLFVDSFTSTAILPETKTAKDESLHEIEYILPKPKKEILENMIVKNTKNLILQKLKEMNELKWIGLLNISDDIKRELKNMKIFVGGDVRYGYGLMKIIDLKEVNDTDLEQWNINEDGTLNIRSTKPLLSFLEFDKSIIFEGKLELLPQFEFLPKLQFKDAKFAISVGSKIENDITQKDHESTKGYNLTKGVFTKYEKVSNI